MSVRAPKKKPVVVVSLALSLGLSLAMALDVGACGGAAPRAAFPTPDQRVADLDELCQFVEDTYAFEGKPVEWGAVRAAYRERAAAAADRHALVRVFENVLDELYDAHSHLGTNYDDSWQLVAHDVWAEWREDRAVIAEVRLHSAASAAGLRPGMVIERIDDQPIRAAAKARGPHHLRAPDPAADEWALLSALGGRHDRARTIVAGGASYTLARDSDSPGGPLVIGRRLDAEVAYIRIAGFGQEDIVAQFDAALEAVRDARALVIDVRDNPGGDTAYAKPILGRLLDRRGQYASMSRRAGPGMAARWPEYIDPRGPWTFRGPVVVLVNHWSESMAEGFAIAIDGLHRGVVVGTQMAGLGAGIARKELRYSKIPVQISAEPVYQVDGRPRNDFRPAVIVDLSAPVDDPILEAGHAAARAVLNHEQRR